MEPLGVLIGRCAPAVNVGSASPCGCINSNKKMSLAIFFFVATTKSESDVLSFISSWSKGFYF